MPWWCRGDDNNYKDDRGESVSLSIEILPGDYWSIDYAKWYSKTDRRWMLRKQNKLLSHSLKSPRLADWWWGLILSPVDISLCPGQETSHWAYAAHQPDGLKRDCQVYGGCSCSSLSGECSLSTNRISLNVLCQQRPGRCQQVTTVLFTVRNHLNETELYSARADRQVQVMSQQEVLCDQSQVESLE